jgi:hypothetical protein
MGTTLSILLLFVALGLLLLAAAALRPRSAAAPRTTQTFAMALMTGLALGFLALVFFGHPYMLLPMGIGGVLLASWLRPPQPRAMGALLVGFGVLWTAMLGWSLINDLSDPAVSAPGWTPQPLAAGVGLLVLGLVLTLGTVDKREA